ncbi:hypothetical protein RI129_005341 [Pyrocoelia pectoralis]|uniref:Macro domain-containing protein n=1 Tax=Pyrocoelia pectoralis TaxID=417401 RepID=A0AAN7ZK99_9COLE
MPNGKPRVVHFNRLGRYNGNNHADGVRRVTEQKKEVSYEEFQRMYGDNKVASFGVTIERQQDLFTLSSEYSLAHCVAADLRMSRGIASVFKAKFGQVEKLREFGPRVGRVLWLRDRERFIYYLVTKKLSSGKPDYREMWNSLLDLKRRVLWSGIRKIAMPRIGCGLDGLDWRKVRNMLEEIFQGTGVQILVCRFNPKSIPTPGTVDCRRTALRDLGHGLPTIANEFRDEIGFNEGAMLQRLHWLRRV